MKLSKSSLLLLPTALLGMACAFAPSKRGVLPGPTAAAAGAAFTRSLSSPSSSSSCPCVVMFSSTVADVNSETSNTSRQSEYGKSLEYPSTYVVCGKCQSSFALRPEDLGERGRGCRIECSVCSNSWYQSRDRLLDIRDGFEFVPLPQAELDRIARNLEAGRSPDFVGERKLYVGNLDFDTTEDDIREVFAKEGEVGEVNLITDNNTGRSRGFAFVTMMTNEDGDRALEKLNGAEIMGRNINVREPNN